MLLTGDAQGAAVEFKKGAVVRLQLESLTPGTAVLTGLWAPRALRAAAD